MIDTDGIPLISAKPKFPTDNLHGRSCKEVLNALRRQLKWAPSQFGKPMNSQRWNTIVDIRSACVQLLGESHRDYTQWMNRRGRRRLLNRAKEFTESKQVNRAFVDLLELTVSDVEACATFMSKRDPGPLPFLRDRPPATPAQTAARRANIQKAKTAREAARASAARWREARLAQAPRGHSLDERCGTTCFSETA